MTLANEPGVLREPNGIAMMERYELDAEVRAKMTPRAKLVTVRDCADLAEAKRLMNKHRLERLVVVNEAFESHSSWIISR